MGKDNQIFSAWRIRYIEQKVRQHTITEPLGAERGPWAQTASRANLLAVLDNAPFCICIFKGTCGKTLYVNQKTIEITGYNACELPTFRAAEMALCPNAEERRRIRKYVAEVIANGSVTTTYRNVCKDGTIKTIESTNTIVNGLYIMAMVDVTRREAAEAKVRASEARFRSFFEESSEAILLFDGDSIIDCNPAARVILGFSNREETSGRTLTSISPDRQPDGRLSTRKLKSLMTVVRKEKSHRFEWTFVKPDGSKFPAELIVTVMKMWGKQGFYIALRDISEWKEAEDGLLRSKGDLERRVRERTRELRGINKRLLKEIEKRKYAEKELEASREQLRQLSEHIQRTREVERTRVAQDIHDELGQSLSALKIDVTCLEANLSENSEHFLEQTRAIKARIDSAINTVRDICAGLRPSVLDYFGLAAAVEWYLQDFEKRTGLVCYADIDSSLCLSRKGLSMMLYRVFQETMTNIIRHANARTVKVYLKKVRRNLMLRVEDDGKGLSEEQISNTTSFGIVGIQERVRFWGGRSQFVGKPDKGTTVTILIPIEPGKGFSPAQKDGVA